MVGAREIASSCKLGVRGGLSWIKPIVIETRFWNKLIVIATRLWITGVWTNTTEPSDVTDLDLPRPHDATDHAAYDFSDVQFDQARGARGFGGFGFSGGFGFPPLGGAAVPPPQADNAWESVGRWGAQGVDAFKTEKGRGGLLRVDAKDARS